MRINIIHVKWPAFLTCESTVSPPVPTDLGILYAQHNGWLVTWLQRKLGNRHDAADIAHDTFTRILSTTTVRDIPELREPRAYLTTVAKRVLANQLARKSLEQAYLESLLVLPEATVLSVEDRAVLLETLTQLDQLLDDLPAKVRTAFLLSQLEGLSYEEIAAQMKISVRSVTRYMAQGFRQCLRVMLQP